jgi:flagellar basal body-associated protein FliL
MKKSFWVIFGIVLFILILIVALTIFLISNKSDALEEDQIDMAKTYQIGTEYRVV